MVIAKKETHREAQVYSFVLKAGEWRKLFSDLEYKTMLAESLNACVCQQGHDFRLQIHGYLITPKRLFLIIKIKSNQLHKMFDFFYREIREAIRKVTRHIKMKDPYEADAPEEIGYLFEKYNLIDLWMEYLLTGRPVEIPYDSPHLDRLRHYLGNERFCSVTDYSGAKSPVFVHIHYRHE